MLHGAPRTKSGGLSFGCSPNAAAPPGFTFLCTWQRRNWKPEALQCVGWEVMVVCYPEVFPRSKSLGCCQRRAPRSALEAWNDAHDRLLANPQSGEQVHWRDLRVMTPGEHPLAVSEPVRRCVTARRTGSE